MAFTNLYEECYGELRTREETGTSLFPDSNPGDNLNEYDEFYDTCNAVIHPKTSPDGRAASSSPGGTCVDDPTFGPSSYCIDEYDQSMGKGACHQALASGYTCENLPGGYCSRSCDQCNVCPLFGPGQTQGCNCDAVGGIANCPEACNGYCAAEVAGVQQLVVQSGDDPTVRPAQGDIQGECPVNTGRHQWFRFMAYQGNSYQIYTELVDGGLTSTYLHLHAKDAQQSELASSKTWHCDDPNLAPSGPGASCMVWACTATGEYAIRVQQMAGSGAFRVGVNGKGLLQRIAEDEGLAPQLTENPSPQGVYLDRWPMTVDTHCDLIYCTFVKDAGTPSARELTADGERFVMSITGVPGATYTFNLALRGAEPAASYVKIAATPRGAQGGADAFAGNSNMMREISLGSWQATEESHHNYHEFNSEYDMKDYHNYPGRESAATGHWKWVCPAAGEYFIVVTSNCDVPVLDDVEANVDASGLPVAGTETCETSWTMDLHVEDETTEITLPIVVVGPPEDAAAGSAAQQVAANEAAVAHPAQTETLNHMASHPAAGITEQTAHDICQLPVELMCEAGAAQCEMPSSEIAERCAQMAMAFPLAPTLQPLLPDRDQGLPPLPPLPQLPDNHGHRLLQHGSEATQATLTHLTANHIQYRAPNREIILERHQQNQRHACMRHGLQKHQCPGAFVGGDGGNGRRRLGDDQEVEITDHHGLTWEEEMAIVQAGAKVGASIQEHGHHLLDANRRALKAEKELARVRKELEAVTRQRDLLLQQR